MWERRCSLLRSPIMRKQNNNNNTTFSNTNTTNITTTSNNNNNNNNNNHSVYYCQLFIHNVLTYFFKIQLNIQFLQFRWLNLSICTVV
ncbi:unnamed protein product [Schistosoma margrebowiei]|uniref:Uncharacterized protein n=1 Tax=Schistosoma margrebowiei TaxID=48269 RepID=A0A183MVD5_9TREM|nr:unnamed protein product [Schistosoma margrebowiei]